MGTFDTLIDYWVSIQNYLPRFLETCLVVLELTVGGVLLSWACGMIAGLGSMSNSRIIRIPCRFYIWFTRGTPKLLQIFIWYFGLPQLGLQLSPFIAGIIGLGVNSGAYIAEIVRSGISAIPRGQFESSQALGMSYFLYMRRVILPQAIRVIMPPITNRAITLLKDTSLLSAITVMELTLAVQLVVARTYRPLDFYIIAAILYLIMTSVLSMLSGRIEQRLNLPYERSS